MFYFLIFKPFWYNQKDFLFHDSKIVLFYLSWVFISLLRGLTIADNYWEFKNLFSSSFYLILPVIIYLFNNSTVIILIFRNYFKYSLIILLFVFPFLEGEAYGRFLAPFSFLSIYFKELSTQWRIVIIFTILLVVISDISARSNVIKFIIPFIFGLLVYFKSYISVKLFNNFRILLLVLPFILFLLSFFGIFNIFRMDQYIGEYETSIIDRKGNIDNANLTADTRTFLYVEVLSSAIKHDYVLFGRTSARGNESDYFGDYNKETLKTGKNERFDNEVSILNIFTWLGILGVLLYFLVFIKSTYLAINKSRNIYIKIIGLLVSFRWLYGWVEDFSRFDLSNIVLWIMIGMCFSKIFRNMSDIDFKNWAYNLLDFRKIVH